MIIRLRKKKSGCNLSKTLIEFVIIDKKKALNSRKFKNVIGLYNKQTNLIILNFIYLWQYLGRGCSFSNGCYSILRSVLF